MFNGNFYGLPRNEAWDPLQVFQKVNCLAILASAEHLNTPVIRYLTAVTLRAKFKPSVEVDKHDARCW